MYPDPAGWQDIEEPYNGQSNGQRVGLGDCDSQDN